MSKLSRQKKLLIFGMKYLHFFTKLWYRITLFFTKKNGHPVKTVTDIRRIPELLDFGADYKPDPRIDVFYHPSRVQRMIDNRIFRHFDCEDHAGYWVTNILKSKLAPKVNLGIMMFVQDGKIEGHVICVYQDDFGKYWWGDYNYPKQIAGKWDWAEECAAGYNSVPFAAALIEVTGIKSDDTPILGKYTFHEF